MVWLAKAELLLLASALGDLSLIKIVGQGFLRIEQNLPKVLNGLSDVLIPKSESFIVSFHEGESDVIVWTKESSDQGKNIFEILREINFHDFQLQTLALCYISRQM